MVRVKEVDMEIERIARACARVHCKFWLQNASAKELRNSEDKFWECYQRQAKEWLKIKNELKNVRKKS